MQKKICTPPPRSGDAIFGVSPSPAFGNSLGALHCRPQCNENHVVYAILHSFSHIAISIRCKKMDSHLCQGQATRLLAHRLAQRSTLHSKPKIHHSLIYFTPFFIFTFRGGGAGCCAVFCYEIRRFNNLQLFAKALLAYDATEVVVLLNGINL